MATGSSKGDLKRVRLAASICVASLQLMSMHTKARKNSAAGSFNLPVTDALIKLLMLIILWIHTFQNCDHCSLHTLGYGQLPSHSKCTCILCTHARKTCPIVIWRHVQCRDKKLSTCKRDNTLLSHTMLCKRNCTTVQLFTTREVDENINSQMNISTWYIDIWCRLNKTLETHCDAYFIFRNNEKLTYNEFSNNCFQISKKLTEG